MQWGLQEPRPARLPDRTRPSRLEFEMANAYLRQRMCACYVSDLQDRYECPCVRDVAPECSRLNCCFPHIELEQGANECHSGRSGERQVDNPANVTNLGLKRKQVKESSKLKSAKRRKRITNIGRWVGSGPARPPPAHKSLKGTLTKLQAQPDKCIRHSGHP